jgi:proline iminopeptidase
MLRTRTLEATRIRIRSAGADGGNTPQWPHSLSPGYVPNRRFEDPAFRSLFTRLVTRYWRHAAFLDEDQLVHNASLLSDIPGVLLHGRYDISSPLEAAWRLHQAWRGSELHIIDTAGHGDGAMPDRIVEAMNRVALVL